MNLDRMMRRAARTNIKATGLTADVERLRGGWVRGCRVNLMRDVEPSSVGNTEVVTRRTELEMLVEEVGELNKDDLVHVGSQEWKCAAKVANDGYTTRWVVSEFR